MKPFAHYCGLHCWHDKHEKDGKRVPWEISLAFGSHGKYVRPEGVMISYWWKCCWCGKLSESGGDHY